MATVWYFWHDFIHRDTSFIYLQYSHSLIYHLLPNVWKASYTISASIFVDVAYCPSYSMDKFISYIVPGPTQWFFHFGEEIVIAWTHIGWVRWMFSTWGRLVRRLSWTASLTSWNALTHHATVQYGKAASPHASRNPWKHSCVPRPHATSILIQERCSSFVNMVLALALSLWKKTFYRLQ